MSGSRADVTLLTTYALAQEDSEGRVNLVTTYALTQEPSEARVNMIAVYTIEASASNPLPNRKKRGVYVSTSG